MKPHCGRRLRQVFRSVSWDFRAGLNRASPAGVKAVRGGSRRDRYPNCGQKRCALVVPEQRQEDDDGKGNPKQPKKQASTKTHNNLHCVPR
jgi:hypothetical protein